MSAQGGLNGESSGGGAQWGGMRYPDVPFPDDGVMDMIGGNQSMIRREAAKIELAPLPSIPGFRAWRTSAFREIAGCSTEPQRAFVWISQIESEASDQELNVCDGAFASLDGKLAASLSRI
eukprot:4851845-Amphidinium_carterae.3